ncbi:MAG: DNA-binding protein [Gallionella sp.]
MAREANTTYEQVAAAADDLKAKDVKPTSRAVREVLGTGSMATVCKFLEQWKSGQARQSQVTDYSIDQSVARALNAHIATKIQTAISDSTSTPSWPSAKRWWISVITAQISSSCLPNMMPIFS